MTDDCHSVTRPVAPHRMRFLSCPICLTSMVTILVYNPTYQPILSHHANINLNNFKKAVCDKRHLLNRLTSSALSKYFIYYCVNTLSQWLRQLLIRRLFFCDEYFISFSILLSYHVITSTVYSLNNASFYSGKIWSLWELRMHRSGICVLCAPSSTHISCSVLFASRSIALSV